MINIDWLAYLGSWEAERCGLVLKKGETVELPNVHEDPTHNFEIDSADAEPFLSDLAGLWHTHCSDDYNLSVMDYEAFLEHPTLTHLVISRVGVASYYVVDGVVVNGERRLFYGQG